MRLNEKQRMTVGASFFENEEKQNVTRVTDVDFDTVGEFSQTLKVRNLGLFDSDKFMNSISGFTSPIPQFIKATERYN